MRGNLTIEVNQKAMLMASTSLNVGQLSHWSDTKRATRKILKYEITLILHYLFAYNIKVMFPFTSIHNEK